MASTADLDNLTAERKQRRRIQNRVNQRARRLRLRRTSNENSRTRQRPYKVDRWRLDDSELAEGLNTTRFEDGLPVHDGSVSGTTTATILSTEHPDFFPFPADHLLNLIHFNVSRGLRQNKLILWRSTSSYMPGHNLVPVTLFPEALFYGSSLISRVYQGRLPPTLAPTQPQMSLIHATWINILPFPRMRENLIQWENSFSHSEFIADLVGDLVDTRRFFSSPASQVPNEVPQSTVVLQAADDEVTSNRNGLIIWGEPERAESWEATPGFLRKWMWVVEGCKELIESTNRWRRVRGEEPIVLSMH